MPIPGEAICALITPPGFAAINVLRISGKGSIGIVAQYFRPRKKLLNSPSHHAIFGVFHDRAGNPLDQVLCTVFRSPHSYTGEDSVEISCHGNPQISASILENLLLEARLAQPGEFTLRALLNGKLDLLQAEAVNDLICATGNRAGSAALMQVQGYLSSHLKLLLDAITDARLRCELAIDFSDQDLPQIDLIVLQKRVTALLEQARALYNDGNRGKYIREGIRICLAGAPNSGKSSLFNAFLKYNRAIVTPHPGTTRDYLEESVSLHGYTLVLYDTAGLRESTDSIEREGIDRAKELMRDSDLVLWLKAFDDEHSDSDILSLPEEIAAKTLYLSSKSDLIQTIPNTSQDASHIDGSSPLSRLPVSVITADGMNRLYEAILQRFSLPREELSQPLITNSRHLAALQRCISALENAQDSLRTDSGFEFTAFDLITASKALEEILGIVTTDDLLGQIFSSFCIGK